jgi:hypothetical protein
MSMVAPKVSTSGATATLSMLLRAIEGLLPRKYG